MMFPKFNLLGKIGTSIVRTIVPIVAGIAVSWAVRHGFHLDQAEVTAWLTPLCGGAWYTAARWLEEKAGPRWGWLLGKATTPSYSPTS